MHTMHTKWCDKWNCAWGYYNHPNYIVRSAPSAPQCHLSHHLIAIYACLLGSFFTVNAGYMQR